MPEASPLTPETGWRRYLWRNYLVHSIEGGLFFAALNFVSASTLLPTIIRDLGGPNWLISLMPVMMTVGVMLPPIFTAHLIDRLGRYMPLLLVTGVFQRLPYLLAALALLYGSPLLALCAAATAPLVSGVFCGVGLTAWQQLVIQTIPAHRRSGLFAARSMIFCVLGLGAGWVVRVVLGAWPGRGGYGILYLCAFGLLVISYAVFAMIREIPPAGDGEKEPLGLIDNLRAMPGIVRGDRRLRRFLLVNGFMSGIFILTPFLAIHAREVVGRPESYLGDLLIVQMIGAIVGNVLSGYLGDRYGGKSVVMLSAAVFAGLAAVSAVVTSDWGFRGVFFAFGLAFTALMIGGRTLSLDVCRATKRSTYLAIIAFAKLLTMLAATGISGAIWNGRERFVYLAALTAGCVLAAMGFLAAMREPRKDAPPAP